MDLSNIHLLYKKYFEIGDKMRKEQKFYEFTIPEIGYGSRFDFIGFESDELKLKMTEKQLVKINRWLKRHFKYIKIVEFWQFRIMDEEEMFQCFQYDEELYEMCMHFFPELLYEQKLNPIHKFLLRIKPIMPLSLKMYLSKF